MKYLKKKTYSIISMILLQFKIIPFASFFSLIYSAIDALLIVLQTISMAWFIDTATAIFNETKDYEDIFLPLLLIVVCIFMSHVLPVVADLINSLGRNKLQLTIDSEIAEKHALLEYKHLENKETCELIHRVENNFSAFLSQTVDNAFDILNLLITVSSLMVLIMSSSVLAGLIIIAVGIPFLFMANRIGEKKYELSLETERLQMQYSECSRLLTDKETSEERTLFGFGDHIAERHDEIFDKTLKNQKNIIYKDYFYLKIGSLLTLFVAVGIIALLLIPLFENRMSVGVFISLVPAVFSMVQNMSYRLSDIAENNSYIRSFLKDCSNYLLLSEKQGASAPRNMNKDLFFEKLEFIDVSFKYPGTDKYILNHCTFKMVKGKTYALVGENGAGKTTIVKLALGMYDDYEGKILLNGIDIKDYAYSDIKSLLAVLFQDFSRFAVSIEENIRLGNLQKFHNDDIEMNQLLSLVGLSSIIVENGLRTNLGRIRSDGRDISGGEWQRIAIARLLYSDAQVNILDEPTAALDPLEESKLYEMFKNINLGKTMILITHRLGATKIADTIFVVDDGRIIEQGSHEELMKNANGKYCCMFSSQKQWYNHREE